MPLVFWSCCCFGELKIIEESISPDKKLALASEIPEKESGDGEFISLVRLPNKVPIGVAIPTREQLGLPGRGRSVWKQKEKRFAFVQGGIPWSWTMVFKYTNNSFEELPLPDFSRIPRQWFDKATDFKRSYVVARNWRGRDQLELEVSGVAVFNGGKIECNHSPNRIYRFE